MNAPLRALLLVVLAMALAVPGAARDRSSDQSGAFDHYLLAVTWMPSFCALTGDARGDDRCAPGQRRGWQVHGLWPQHADGSWPEFCRAPHRNPSRRETARQVDLFGASGAAWHQWNKHGSCTGISPVDYYALTRAALERISLPGQFEAATSDRTVAPEALEAAVIAANPGLTPEMLLVTCRRDAVYELRLCLTRDLTPRPCAPQTLLRACALDAARLPVPR